jgi:hypothetical protein
LTTRQLTLPKASSKFDHKSCMAAFMIEFLQSIYRQNSFVTRCSGQF